MNNLITILNKLQCPACGNRLHLDNRTIFCDEDHSFEQNASSINLTYPYQLSGNDAVFYEQYKEIAAHYDQAADQLFAMHGTKQEIVRSELVQLAGLQPGDRVLEISTGTGLNIPHILERIGHDGELVVLDLSPSMLEVAKSKFSGEDHEKYQIEFVLSNASYLPFDDNTFDAVIHVGGINTFTERKRALDEMQRVVKIGGKIVISDEGMGPWNLDTEYGQKLLRINGLYKEHPPIDLLPVEIEDVSLHWVMGNVFYVLSWQKRDGQPLLIVSDQEDRTK